RRAADGDRDRRRRRQPASPRHQRHGRYDRGGDSGAIDGAGVLRLSAARAGRGPGEGGGGGGSRGGRPAGASEVIAVVMLRDPATPGLRRDLRSDRKSTRLNSSHEWISYAVFCW